MLWRMETGLLGSGVLSHSRCIALHAHVTLTCCFNLLGLTVLFSSGRGWTSGYTNKWLQEDLGWHYGDPEWILAEGQETGLKEDCWLRVGLGSRICQFSRQTRVNWAKNDWEEQENPHWAAEDLREAVGTCLQINLGAFVGRMKKACS